MTARSFSRQIKIEDISELTRRRGAVSVKVRLNKPPQLEEVDQRIGQLVDVLMILDKSMDKLEQDYFQEIVAMDSEAESLVQVSEATDPDDTWNQLQQEYHGEIQERDEEYEALLRRFSLPPPE
jgi:hypothetical protein